MCTRTTYTLLSVYTQERNGKPVITSRPTARQRGSTLVEILVAMLLSLIVSCAAVITLSNSLDFNHSAMQYAQLSNELRRTVQLMSRDVRRAGYTAGAQWCLANTLCMPGTTIALPDALGILDPLPLLESIQLPAGITVNESGDCFTFELDRDQDATIGSGDYGGYRRIETDGVGVLMTWMGTGSPDCGEADDFWSPVTSSSDININTLTVDDSGSFDELVSTDILGNTTSQKVRRILIRVSGQLVSDAEVSATVQTTIDVRNDIMI